MPGEYSYHERDPNLIFSKGGQKVVIDLSPLLERHLKDDRFWGGHQYANQARYQQNRAGVAPVINNAVSDPDGMLAVLRWYMVGASSSAQSILGEELIRLVVDPKPELIKIRPLRKPSQGAGFNPSPGHLRLFRIGNRRLLLDPGELLELASSGKTMKRVAGVGADWRLLGDQSERWLAFRSYDQRSSPKVAILDLTSNGAGLKLLHYWKGESLYSEPYLSDGGFVFNLSDRAEAVIIPSGIRIQVKCPGETVEDAWMSDGLFVVRTRTTIRLVDTDTRRELAHLPVHPVRQ